MSGKNKYAIMILITALLLIAMVYVVYEKRMQALEDKIVHRPVN